MKPFLFFGAPDRVCFDGPGSTIHAHKACGRDAANILIGHSVHQQIQAEASNSIGLDFLRIAPEQINHDYSVIIFICPNKLESLGSYHSLADYFSAIKIPIIPIGLGLSEHLDEENSALKEKGIIRFCRELSAHCVSIGVRGELTASLLTEFGVTNLDIIGCPSCFMNGHPFLTLPALPRHPERIIFHLDPMIRHKIRFAPIFKQISEEFTQTRATYYIQDETLLAVLAREGEETSSPEIIQQSRWYFHLRKGDPGAEDFLNNCLRVYFNAKQWAAETRKHDCSIGSSFHYNMLSVINHIPALFFVHNTGSYELCRHFQLPFFETRQLLGQPLLPRVSELDFSAAIRLYPIRYYAYAAFLNKNGLPHRLLPDASLTGSPHISQ